MDDGYVYGQPIKMDLFLHSYQQRSPQKWEMILVNYIIRSPMNLVNLFMIVLKQKQSPEQKEKLKNLSSSEIKHKELAGEKIKSILTNAPGNNAAIGGIKVITENAWFAARPSGTEDIYKIYAESFLSKDHLNKIIDEAQTVVNAALEMK